MLNQFDNIDKGCKVLCNRYISFYISTSLAKFEYTQLQLRAMPKEIIVQYAIRDIAIDRWVCYEIHKDIFGLPLTKKIANNWLIKNLVT